MRNAYLFLFLASSWGLVSCSTPPELGDRLNNGASPQPVQIKGAHSLLTPAQSATILERLNQRGDSTLLDRHIAFEEALLEHPLVVGNQVTLLQDGPATYTAMFAALAQAKDHINLETYIFEDDEVGRRFADVLLKKQAEGVQVNLIYDSVGSLNTTRAFFDELRNGGISVLEYNPLNPLRTRNKWLINNRDHRKLLVIDGKVAFLGGVNISRVYSRGSHFFKRKKADKEQIPWRDTHLQLEGPVVADFQRCFLSTWERQKGPALTEKRYFPTLSRRGDELVRAIPGAFEEPYSQVYVTLISAISHAEKYVQLTNAYFVPDEQFLQTLIDTAQRGVEVRLILPGKTDSWATLQAGRSYYSRLLRAGVKIYERRGALLHAKTATVDGVWSSVGSSNLDWRSFVHNDELNAEILGTTFATQMQQMFEQDVEQSDSIDAARWEKRSPLQRLKEWTAKIWAYWL